MAFLRSVRLRGFKTFARSTELLFEPGVTVFIGPNGSGKSNIADAVLWGLGEQSPSSIRSRTMQDVIFSGSDGQKASAVAEVGLVFDNTMGRFPVDFTDVEITRRLLRDGSSEYRLNGAPCRLLDVQELVAAVGLGREMHSVISQGRVEELVLSTPATRRALVEEAAGLGRYKKRRDRTQSKLDKVRVNLDRVAAVEREVRTALRPLKLQVTAAERHATLAEDLAVARAKGLLLELTELTDELDGRREESRAVTARRLELESELSRLREERGDEEERFAEALGRRERLTAAFHRARAELERLESRGGAVRQRIARFEGDIQRTERRTAAAAQEASSAARRLDELGDDPGAAGVRLLRVEEAATAVAERLQAVRPALVAALETEDRAKDGVFEAEAARSRLRQEMEFLHREQEEARRRQESLEEQGEDMGRRLSALAAVVSGHRELVERAGVAAASAQRAAEEAEVEMDRAAQTAGAAREDLRRVTEEAATVESRARVLREVISRREGVPAAARRLLDRERGAALVTDLLDVEAGYERAVAAALGPLAAAVVIAGDTGPDPLGSTQGPVEILMPRRAAETAVPSGISAQPELVDPSGLPPAGTRHLFEVIDASPQVLSALSALLPPTFVHVGDGAPTGTVPHVRVVTRTGEVYHGGFHAARRGDTGAETLLAARAELRALEADRQRLLEAVASAERSVAEVDAMREQAEAAFVEATGELRALQSAAASAADELELSTRRLEEAEAEQGEIRRRLDEGGGAASRLAGDVESLTERISSAESHLEQARAELRRTREEAERLRSEGAYLEGKRSQAALLGVRLRERVRAWQEEHDRVAAQRAAALLAVETASRRVERLAGLVPTLAELDQTIHGLTAELSRALGAIEVEVTRSRSEGDRFGEALREHGVREADVQRAQAAEAERLVEVEVAVAHLADRVAEREHELGELRRRHIGPRSLTSADVAGESTEALAVAAQRLQSRLDGIGPVNPLAEQEYRETLERAEFLAEQRRDLEASLLELERVIAGLDEHIDSTFAEVFDSISAHFRDMVEILFPGGRGVLRLVEEAPEGDELEEGESPARPAPGIILEIKPPRKAPRTMSLLSGGEKALAAIAFLFALFLARPCPFYVLDEVEAALDDVNLGRFLSVVRRYQEMTQFIIITHQRRTMEVADTLYGVAMDADGTSRVLSRRLSALAPSAEA